MDKALIEAGKMASLGELTAGMAHEINNMVAIMVEKAGWLQDLLDEEEFRKSKNLEEFRSSLEQIQIHGARCKEITQRVLRFTRNAPAEMPETPVKEIVDEMVSFSERRAKSRGIRIQTDIEQGLPELGITATEIQQVLLNLINNALDAMEKTGGMLRISARRTGGDLEIRVSDSGPGIPAENLEKIFSPFFTTKSAGKGNGLGLPISKGIVENVGGRMWVESVEGKGAVFYIRFPIPSKGPGESGLD